MDNIRPSLTEDLETRYAKSHTGGAFDAKILPKKEASPALEDRYNKQSSMYVQGLDTKKYSQ